jgi:hypothetical protein
MRPVYLRTPYRTQAHIFVAALAFLLHRAIERSSRPRASISLPPRHSPRSSPCASSTSLSATAPPNDPLTQGTQRAAAVLRALGITALDPSAPPHQGETGM